LNAGVNSFVITINADSAKLHNFLAMTNNAFEESISGLQNIIKLKKGKDITLGTNTVITTYNYKILPRIINFLLGFDIQIYYITPIIIDGFAYYNKNILVPKLSVIAPFVHKSIDLLRKNNKELVTSSLPYCLMKGYENTISDMRLVNTILDGPDCKIFVLQNRQRFRIKTDRCKLCKYFNICLGVWIRYVKMFGFGEFIPVPGKPIQDMNEVY